MIVVEAQISALIYDFASKPFILFTPEIADFVGDLLRNFLQKSSFRRFQNYSLIVESKI